ncbi:MAG: SMC-Scp complex subunit ScpB [Candidatus Omnitrophica bacterium]|nr:SMC-Scp complex subunit ScpB [Candidatus Omnitrophota bacterium]
MTREEAKRIIEALLFATNKPVPINDMARAIEDIDAALIRDLLEELNKEYESQNRSFSVAEIAGGFQLVADAYYAPWIKKLLNKEKTQRLSMPALETLAIIAYKQPITRSEIETVRGVNIDGVIESLLEKNLIKTSGRREAPGRPFVYTVTDEFLSHFGLRSLEDLPKLKEFTKEEIEAGQRDLVIEKPDMEGKNNGTRETAKTD